jgi:hypothetical protein
MRFTTILISLSILFLPAADPASKKPAKKKAAAASTIPQKACTSSFVDKTGAVVVKPAVTVLTGFTEGRARFKEKDKCGFIDRKGKIAIAATYDEARDFSEGLSAVKIGSAWGFIDKKGKTVIDPVFYYAGSFAEGLAPVGLEYPYTYPKPKAGWAGTGLLASLGLFPVAPMTFPEPPPPRFGFIDHAGKMTIPLEYDCAGEFHDGLAIVCNYYSRGYIDPKGTVVIPPQFGSDYWFSQGLCQAWTDDNKKVGFMDKTGKVVLDRKYDDAGPFKGGLAWVKIKGAFGFIDKKGKLAIAAAWDYADDFSEGRARVEKDKKWGFVDEKGKVVVKPSYDWVSNFSEGLAAVRKGEKAGYVDKDGNVAIALTHRTTDAFSEGLGLVLDCTP